MATCKNCNSETHKTFYDIAICDTCRKDICFLCSERKQTIIFFEQCESHTIDAPYKGNRFMEDKAFMGGGPFEFEPE